MIQIEGCSLFTLCAESSQNIVCSSHLCKGLFIVGAMDNIDHDPSSTTAQSSFRGTGIGLTQFPRADDVGTAIEPVATVATERLDIPHSYTIVPAVALNQSKAEVVQRTYVETFCGNLKKAIEKEYVWLKNAVVKLQYSFDKYKPLIWASHHAHLQPPMIEPPSISATLPLFTLFTRKADSPAMINHAMDILQSVTTLLHQSWHVTVPSLPKQSSFNGHGQSCMEKMYSL